MQPSSRPTMTTYPISVSLLQYQSCMQFLLINTLPPSSWILAVLKLNLHLHSQQHTLWLLTILVFHEYINTLYLTSPITSPPKLIVIPFLPVHFWLLIALSLVLFFAPNVMPMICFSFSCSFLEGLTPQSLLYTPVLWMVSQLN